MRFQFIVLFVSIFFATVGYSNSIQKRTDVLDNDRMNATMMTVVLQRLKYVDNYNDDMKQKTSLEDSNVRLKSYNNGSFCVDNDQYNRNNHYIKQTKSNRINDHIILLKRRVTQQQFRHNKNQITTFQETTYELPSSVDLVLMSRRKESLSSRHYEMKQSSCVVC
ncbi:unnamed protein product [Rotaria magnacalcarata]|uniref:Uncharacterized protein n=1 Tax=Rotaria magnacalcarata TaxID=392030 RepID=A0A816AWI6_9BILA|nr:unnamed protein product [Rotaria magnacalcarata]CAF2027513.1 unnamed protein product [Rotaria magnacalcarata]